MGVQNQDPLTSLHAKAVQMFSKYLEQIPSSYFPHLSLFYGEHTPELLKSFQDAVSQAHLANSLLSLDTIDIVLTHGTIEKW